MCPRWRRLQPGQAAADSIKLQTCILRGFDGAAHGFTHEGRHFNSALLHVEDHCAFGWRGLCSGSNIWCGFWLLPNLAR